MELAYSTPPQSIVILATSRRNTGNIRVGTTNTCPDQPIIDLASATDAHTRQLDTSPQTAGLAMELDPQPAASSTTLSDTNVRNPTFTPDVPDLYVFRLYATNAAGAF